MFYIHKHSESLEYGGPEEGGWWFTEGIPVEDWKPEDHKFADEDTAYAACRDLNEQEKERRHNEEEFDYHSVLAYRSNHYSYRVEESPVPQSYPEERPFYC